VGGTETLFAAITPSNATNQSVTWSSSSPSVAAVSEGGVVTGLSAGTAVITVTTVDGGHQAACTVTVSTVNVAVTGVSLNKTSADLAVGSSETLFAAITPSNATNQSVIWSSSSPAVAAVSGGGVVTGISVGTAVITVTTVDGGHQASCSVTVGNRVIDNLLTESRYQAAPYDGSFPDNIKYSYRYNGYDFYYIYLGQLRNIPLFSGMEYEHTGLNYVYTYTKTDEETISKAVTKSSEETVSVSNEHTESTTHGVKAGFEISTKYNWWVLDGEFKLHAEYNWEKLTSDTSTFTRTTSLTNTVEEGTSRTKTTQESASITITKEDRPGVYRFTCFTGSDVYLYVIRDPTKPNEIYYEFVEHIIPGARWRMDYSQLGDFNKNDPSKFVFDSSILKNLPTPKLDLSEVLSLNITSADLKKGETVTLTATITPINTSNKNVTWSSSNPAVATVSNTGTVTAISTGSAIITVRTVVGGLTAECKVTVSPPPLKTTFEDNRDNIRAVTDNAREYQFDTYYTGMDKDRLRNEGYKSVTIYLGFEFVTVDTGYIGICIYGGTDQIRAPTEGGVPGAWHCRSDIDLLSEGKTYFHDWTVTVPIAQFNPDFTVRWWARGSGKDSYNLGRRPLSVWANK